MSDRNDFFSRVAGRVDLPLLSRLLVVIVGAGSVGSIVGVELAQCGIGHLAFIDGDRLELHNAARHALPPAYVGTNKAEAMAAHLSLSVPGIDVGALPRYVDDSLTDRELDQLLATAHLVIIATDARVVQRRVARRALALDLPAIVPGLYADQGGEVFVQLDPAHACFLCWDAFRAADAEVRGATSVGADALQVIQQSIFLTLAVLDPHSRHMRELAPPAGDARPRQLFVLRPGAALLRAPVLRRPGCESCAVGPSPLAHVEPHDTAARELSGDAAADWALSLAPPLPPVFDRVKVSERVVFEGDAVTVSWSARNATHVEVETAGRRPATGEVEVPVRATRTIRLVAVNPFGRSERLTPVVRAIPLPRLRPLEPPPFPLLEPPAALAWPAPIFPGPPR